MSFVLAQERRPSVVCMSWLRWYKNYHWAGAKAYLFCRSHVPLLQWAVHLSQMNQQRKKQVLQPSWKTITQSKAVNQYLPGFFGRAGFSLSSRNHIVFDVNVPHSHHVQVVSNDRQNECYVCRLKNPLVRHVAAAASAKTDWKDWKEQLSVKTRSHGLVQTQNLFYFPSFSFWFFFFRRNRAH